MLTTSRIKTRPPRPKVSNVGNGNRISESKPQLKGPVKIKKPVSRAKSVHSFKLDPNNNETPDMPLRTLRPTKSKGSLLSGSCKTELFTPSKTLFEAPVVVRLPTLSVFFLHFITLELGKSNKSNDSFLEKSSARLQVPTNGPGLTFLPRNWKDEAPKACGKWVRIFPFDHVTSKCSTFKVAADPPDCIRRVSNFDLFHKMLKLF